MSSGGSPSTQDVRLVAAAVHSAEEAALTYAREIGEARKHLTAAIEHLDRAERARTMLNRHAGGLMGAESAPPPRRDTPVSTPSPGIAVAGETGPAVPAPPPRRPSGWGPEPTGNS